MKLSFAIITSMAAATFARPKPQSIDLKLCAALNLGAKVTVFSTVTVTAPASTCLPAATTLGSPGQISVRTTTSRSSLTTQRTSRTTSVSQTTRQSLSQTTSRPVSTGTTSRPVTTRTTSTPRSSSRTSSSSRPTGTQQAFLSAGLSYQAAILYHHNAARANHGAPPLTWDASCEANARIAANTCNYAPYLPAGVNQGQNRYVTAGTAFNVTAAITEVWYKSELSAAAPWFEIADIPTRWLPIIGQLTQMLWKGTSAVGCASVDCGTRMKVNGAPSSLNKYTVCNYAPAGNIAGQFAINVGLPISTANPGKWTD